MFKVNNKGTGTTHSGAVIVNFELISHLFVVFLSWTLKK